MTLSPSTDYRYAFKKGMSGTDVAALQINLLYVTVDGVFGDQTDAAVRTFQGKQHLLDDGVAGLKTQQALCILHSNSAARNHGLPSGLLKSILSNESNFMVAAVSHHPSDGGIDVGAYQISSGTALGSENFYHDAYDITKAADLTATAVKKRHDTTPDPVPSKYLTDLAGDDVDKFKWQISILDHNWPVAAQNIPKYGYIYTDHARDDETASWVVSASAGRLSTPRQWVQSYVERATTYVKW